MTVNQGLIQGLWKCRNRETDTAAERETIRTWLRQCVRIERLRQQSLHS